VTFSLVFLLHFRQTHFQMSVPKRRRSNVSCLVKVDVRSEHCDPRMEVLFSLYFSSLLYNYEVTV